MSRKKYRVWRIIVRRANVNLSLRCLHDTDNLQEIRDRYRNLFSNRVTIQLCYTEFK